MAGTKFSVSGEWILWSVSGGLHWAAVWNGAYGISSFLFYFPNVDLALLTLTFSPYVGLRSPVCFIPAPKSVCPSTDGVGLCRSVVTQ